MEEAGTPAGVAVECEEVEEPASGAASRVEGVFAGAVCPAEAASAAEVVTEDQVRRAED